MKEFSCVLLAGGIGSRTKKEIPKQFFLLNGKPLIFHSFIKFYEIDEIKEIIITCPKDYIDDTKEKVIGNIIFEREQTKIRFIQGGITRQKSVLIALKNCKYNNVIIHEAARPLVSKEDIFKIINSDKEAITLVNKIDFTVLEKKGNSIKNILKRENLVNIMLPQKYNRDKLLEAHEYYNKTNIEFTDDSSLYYDYYKECYIEYGDPKNIKITDYKDFITAEAILGEKYE
jgi:2-C-methyl-D-erythritol 4-phosphate cytidylyltransferase